MDQNDVQGRLAAQGDVNIGNSYQSNCFLFDHKNGGDRKNCDELSNDDFKYAIVAGGTFHFGDGQICNGGIAYGNKDNFYLNEKVEVSLINNHCPIDNTEIINFDKVKNDIVSLSNDLSNLESDIEDCNIDLTIGKNQIVINGDKIVATDYSLKCYINSIEDTGVNPNDITIIVNLSGSDITLSQFDLGALRDYASHIIWNAPNAEKITFNGFRLQGTLLAPKAKIIGKTGNNIQGILIAEEVYGPLEIDIVPFEGCVEIAADADIVFTESESHITQEITTSTSSTKSAPTNTIENENANIVGITESSETLTKTISKSYDEVITDTPTEDDNDSSDEEITDFPEENGNDSNDEDEVEISKTPMEDDNESNDEEISKSPMEDDNESNDEEISKSPMEDDNESNDEEISKSPMEDDNESNDKEISKSPMEDDNESNDEEADNTIKQLYIYIHLCT
ncbi:hypothetical protein H8356DRAFT_1081848 [Neocallimastix lanati (nom. inval.)]|nr:hypothetical protein H8356DRAFT_1081848 [Neocallimastix sp. JGI-2020a]